MRTFAGLVMLVITLLVLAGEIIALSDPTGTGPVSGAAPYGASESWLVHVAVFAVIALMGWGSVRLLRRGTVRRRMRGRGLAPSRR